MDRGFCTADVHTHTLWWSFLEMNEGHNWFYTLFSPRPNYCSLMLKVNPKASLCMHVLAVRNAGGSHISSVHPHRWLLALWECRGETFQFPEGMWEEGGAWSQPHLSLHANPLKCFPSPPPPKTAAAPGITIDLWIFVQRNRLYYKHIDFYSD